MADSARHRATRTKPGPRPSATRTPPRQGGDFKVVAIGASAGGLEACTKLLDALPAPTGMAFILVQHLDPSHKSLLVELLAGHTELAVVQAVDGMAVEREHLHVIPPGSYLSVSAGALRLSPWETRDGAPHGARLPFDALLHSLAAEYGPRTACVVLSGTGSDGSAGVRAIKAAGGLVVVQDPAEAGHGGMPRSAVATGLVDAILPIADIPAALANPPQDGHAAKPASGSSAASLERELDAVRAELEAARRTIEASGEEQRAINEEALSVNEELQALNSQLQETLERQRTTSNDLQNILYSTDVATLFLDRGLNIRFFTPATRALFNVIPGDVGRPLSDLHSLATDALLPADAQAVLQSLEPVEREVETPGGTWFRRRILPYRTEGNGVEGVVITFNDITRRKHEAAALQLAKAEAEAANLAKSRFLAAASHDLRQPLQTLALLGGLLARNVSGDKAAGLVHRLDETLGAMTGMLDTLLDLNQIEAGVVQAEVADCPVGPMLGRLRDEFAYPAQAKGLALRVVPCSATVRTDLRLLEQMLRNLLSNALKYTERGRVLLGVRRHGGNVRIEVWDTGIGIPDQHLQAVFEEYHQVGNEARERARGLGLGLSIVQRLGALLGHRVRVRSRAGHGSVFSIEAALAPHTAPAAKRPGPDHAGDGALTVQPAHPAGTILMIEDDPDMRDLLQLLLQEEGYVVAVAPDGLAALDMVGSTLRPGLVRPGLVLPGLVLPGLVLPGLVLADHNLPGGMTGLQAAAALRATLPGVPVIILTGDISAATLHDVAQAGCRQLNKPVRPADLLRLVQDLLSAPAPVPPQAMAAQDGGPVIFVVDDDATLRAALRSVLEEDGHHVEDYSGGEAFLAAYRPGQEGCLLVDAAMPGMDGLEVLRRLAAAGHRLPAIVITGHGDVAMAVSAMKAGALDFIEKPVSVPDLLAEVIRALGQSHDAGMRSAWQSEAAGSIAALTPRQHDVMAMVLAGHPSKNIAADLGISQRTVENHRAAIMHRTGARSLPALARLALAAASAGTDRPGGPQAANGATPQPGHA